MNVPTATYRIQFRPHLTFEAATEILAYLKDLGVSHVYAAPIVRAVKGSQHGYDIADPAEIDPELGGAEGLDRLFGELESRGLSWIQDIVPSHMSYGPENPYLMDVLEKGARSPYCRYFDIDWVHPYKELQGLVLAPFLGDFYGTCLDRGDIRLVYRDGGFALAYESLVFPLRLDDYPLVLGYDPTDLERRAGGGSGDVMEFSRIVHGFEDLASPVDPPGYARTAAALKAALGSLAGRSGPVSAYIEGVLGRLNGVPGDPATFDGLDALLRRQNFRWSFWKVGNEELNYRRFFAVNDLVSMRTEDRRVFDLLHDRILGLIRDGKVDGLRIDHLDGLSDPREYLGRLRQAFPDLYVVVEKILDRSEELPPDLPAQGTTGYDFLNWVNGLFVDAGGEKAFSRIYERFTGQRAGYRDIVVQKKRLFMGTRMAGDIDNLAHILKTVLGASRYGRDTTIYGLKRGLVEMLAHFPVYRTYVSKGTVTERDRAIISDAAARARESLPASALELDLIERILLLDHWAGTPEPERSEWVRFAKRFQQISCALMAKGAEDTTFYVYNRLLSLNEVGGDPSAFGTSIRDFHDSLRRRRRRSPHSMNATATHDTKRGEDARARLDVLSEIPAEWEEALRAFAKAGRRLKSVVRGRPAPSPNDEYLIYQALIGAYPFSEEERAGLPGRMRSYVVKAIREAKVHTAWIRPDVEYERACERFVGGLLEGGGSQAFMKVFLPLQKKVAAFGIFNSLSQLLLKTACPGVPDVYQGCELWDLSLVDPDNRRRVDFERRRAMLAEIAEEEADLPRLAGELMASREDGRVKLFAIRRLLAARAAFPDLFGSGDYVPLEASGRYRDHVVGFARRGPAGTGIALAPRLLTRVVREDELPLGESVWSDTAFAWPDGWPAELESVLTGRVVRAGKSLKVGAALDLFPIALLIARS